MSDSLEKRARELIQAICYAKEAREDDGKGTCICDEEEFEKIAVEFASSVRRETLEEAAKVAEEMGGVGGMSDRLCERIAAAIRALASPPSHRETKAND